MQLSQRLKRLEQHIAPPGPTQCDVCGLLLPGAPSTGPAKITVAWHEPGESAPPPCRACGQNRVIWIDFDKAG